jgi:response regulator of citrate/malate metabolism
MANHICSYVIGLGVFDKAKCVPVPLTRFTRYLTHYTYKVYLLKRNDVVNQEWIAECRHFAGMPQSRLHLLSGTNHQKNEQSSAAINRNTGAHDNGPMKELRGNLRELLFL